MIAIISLYRVFRKNCVFSQFTATPPYLHRCKIPSKLSTQSECTVTGWYFFVQPITAECWRGRGGKLSIILGKHTIFKHPVNGAKFSSAKNGRTDNRTI